jgi:hypothetical protein
LRKTSCCFRASKTNPFTCGAAGCNWNVAGAVGGLDALYSIETACMCVKCVCGAKSYLGGWFCSLWTGVIGVKAHQSKRSVKITPSAFEDNKIESWPKGLKG